MAFISDVILEDISIPPAPAIIQQLQEQLQKEEQVLMDIANIIAQDMGISSLVLRTVNSSYFGLKVKIRSIQHAASLLGIRNTVNIVNGLVLRRTFEEMDGPNPPNFWESPSNIAMVSANIAQSISRVPSDEAYMLGLFHNSGHALMMQRFSDYRTFYNENANLEGTIITHLENERYQTDHAVLGYYLARSWGLDPKIAELIGAHHSVHEVLASDETTREGILLAILKMAEHIDKQFWGQVIDHEWEQIKDVVLGYVGISEPDFIDLQEDMQDQLISG